MTELVIPNGLNEIGKYTFYGAKGITSVVIPGDVTSIGSYAFAGCTGLTALPMGENVTYISGNAFNGCTGLKNVEIPGHVTGIGTGAFSGCNSLESITVPYVNEKHFGYIFGYSMFTSEPKPYHIKEGNYYYRFLIPTSLKTVTVTGDTAIGDSVFYNCTGITTVIIGDGVTSIGKYAFENCTSLSNVTIGKDVTAISSYAFYNCTALSGVTFKNTAGWTIKSSGTTATSVLPSEISTPASAASLIKSKYYYEWSRA